MSLERKADEAPGLIAAMGEGETRRAPQPRAAYKLAPEVAAQLDAFALTPGRPLLAVDADEVLLDFADHLGRWMETEGWRMSLTEYRLEGAIRRVEDGRAATRAEVGALIGRFFESETERQEVAAGAAEALSELAETAQILVLTNVPQAQREARIRCLARQGVDYPLVANEGGKGRALRWLWDRTRAPIAFVDDADMQLGSVKTHAPGVYRLHFVASEGLRRLTGAAPNAHAQAASWPEARRLLAAALTVSD